VFTEFGDLTMKLWLIITRLFVTFLVVGTIVLVGFSPCSTKMLDGFSNVSSACLSIEADQIDQVIQDIFVDKLQDQNNRFKLVSATDEEDRGDDEADYDNDDKKDDKGSGGWDRIWDSSQLG
jgi:hypothetical protein